jgi:hypothetical protein
MSIAPGLPSKTIILDANTNATMLKISRNTGKPAGPEPTTFSGKSIVTMLPLPP